MARKLVTTDDRTATLAAESPDAKVVELWDMPNAEHAAAGMAERLGVAWMRIFLGKLYQAHLGSGRCYVG